MERLSEATLVVMAAAVSDYTVKQIATQKLKREGARVIELEPTKDILKEIVARKNPGTLVVGFAAETEEMLTNGRAKLERKGADAIVINDVSSSDLGFDSENNAGIFLTHERSVNIPATGKAVMAEKILDEVRHLRAGLPAALRGA